MVMRRVAFTFAPFTAISGLADVGGRDTTFFGTWLTFRF
jgi:hypothetical protein